MTDFPSASSPPDAPATPPRTLASLGVAPRLAGLAADLGWHEPTAIQAQAWPAIVRGRDVLGLAPTGSGKTAAFLLPLLQGLMARPGLADERPRRLQILVLAPTRELARQTAQVARALAPQWRVAALVGGVSINPQMMSLRGGAHLAVATPGRLLDLVAQRALRLSDVQTLVIDEADRLLDLGFADELARVLALLPARRQNLLFSATLPEAVDALADALLHDPVRLAVGARPAAAVAGDATASASAATPAEDLRPEAPVARPSGAVPATIRQRAIVVDTARRTPLLRALIAAEGWQRVLVFVATQYATEHVADKLRQAGLAAAALHGAQSNGRREQALDDLAAGHIGVIVATDLAARGIDIPALDAVVQHDLPRSAVDHTHRIGRTGRAGAAGDAVSFICADVPGSEAQFRLIEKRHHLRLPREQWPGFEPVAAPADAPADAPAGGQKGLDPNGGIKGRRPSRKDKLRAAMATGPGRVR